MDLSWDHFNSSLQAKTHIWPQKTIFGCVAWLSRKIPLKPTKTEPSFRKPNSPPTKLCMLFPAHLQARELCPQTYSLSLPLEWSQVTHIPASIKSGGAYKPKNSAFYSTFARQLCDDTHHPGWLSAFPPHPQTFKPTQASFAHTNSQPSHSMS